MIGCFSAASNITGILADVNAVTTTLHKHGALAFWDYATAGPYVDIDMNPVVDRFDFEYQSKYFTSIFSDVHHYFQRLILDHLFMYNYTTI